MTRYELFTILIAALGVIFTVFGFGWKNAKWFGALAQQITDNHKDTATRFDHLSERITETKADHCAKIGEVHRRMDRIEEKQHDQGLRIAAIETRCEERHKEKAND